MQQHPYFNANLAKQYHARAYSKAVKVLQLQRGAQARDRDFQYAPPSPSDDDTVSLDDHDDDPAQDTEKYGLFSTADSISRMLGPRLHHPERFQSAADKNAAGKRTAGGSGGSTSSRRLARTILSVVVWWCVEGERCASPMRARMRVTR